jgi:hypothetical protein
MDAAPTGRRQNSRTASSARLPQAEPDPTRSDGDIATETRVLRAEVDEMIQRVDKLIARRLAECRRPPGRPGAA